MPGPSKIPPNKGIPDFPAQAIVIDTLVTERRSRYPTGNSPIEPGTPFTPQNHSVEDVANFSGTFLLGQHATDDPEFQNLKWHSPPATQDVYNWDQESSDYNTAYPIFKRKYLILRDYYASVGPLAPNSLFTGLFAVYVTAAGTGYTYGSVVTFSGGGGSGASAIVVTDKNGAIVKITVKSEGSGYTSAPSVVLPAGGSGGSATAVVQLNSGGNTCQLVDEKEVQASDDWISLYVMVERTYETLPGPIRIDWIEDPTTLLPKSIAKQRVATSTVSEPTPSTVGVNISFRHINHAVSEKTTETLDLTLLEDFYAVLPARGSLNVPRVLTGLSAVYTTSEEDGTATETGSGAASGTSGNLNVSSAVHAQASASAIPELLPVWAPRWTEDQPFSDVIVFIAANAVTETQILTALSAALTSFLGSATTVGSWPSFGARELEFVLIGQKQSAAAGATGRISVSWSSDGSTAYMLSDGNEQSKDVGDSIRPSSIPLCLNPGFTLTATGSATASAAASVALDIGGGADNSATVSVTATGSVSPSSIDATDPTGLPTSGWSLYRPDVSLHESGTVMIRGRCYNWANYPT